MSFFPTWFSWSNSPTEKPSQTLEKPRVPRRVVPDNFAAAAGPGVHLVVGGRGTGKTVALGQMLAQIGSPPVVHAHVYNPRSHKGGDGAPSSAGGKDVHWDGRAYTVSVTRADTPLGANEEEDEALRVARALMAHQLETENAHHAALVLDGVWHMSKQMLDVLAAAPERNLWVFASIHALEAVETFGAFRVGAHGALRSVVILSGRCRALRDNRVLPSGMPASERRALSAWCRAEGDRLVWTAPELPDNVCGTLGCWPRTQKSGDVMAEMTAPEPATSWMPSAISSFASTQAAWTIRFAGLQEETETEAERETSENIAA